FKLGAGATLFFIHERSKEDALAQGLTLRDSWKFTVNGGGGFKYLVEEHTVLLFDAEDFVSALPSYGLPFSGQFVDGQYVPGLANTGHIHNLQFSFGVAHRWEDR